MSKILKLMPICEVCKTAKSTYMINGFSVCKKCYYIIANVQRWNR